MAAWGAGHKRMFNIRRCCAAGATLLVGASASAPPSSVTRFPISVINLDSDSARLASVSEELDRAGVPRHQVERLSAVRGKDLLPADLKANATPLARLFCTPGMVGCFLSHRAFWERTLGGSAPWAVVLEDDVRLDDHFGEKAAAAVAALEASEGGKDWDVLMLGALGCVNPSGHHGLNRIHAAVAGNFRQQRFVAPGVLVPHRPFGTHAYALSRRGAAKLLRRASRASNHVDAVIWGLPDLKLYCCAPQLAKQAFVGPSTIGAVLGGLEVRLPDVVVDAYTGVTLKWAFNEPVVQLPGLGVTLTVGRSLVLCAAGFLAAALWASTILAARALAALSTFSPPAAAVADVGAVAAGFVADAAAAAAGGNEGARFAPAAAAGAAAAGAAGAGVGRGVHPVVALVQAVARGSLGGPRRLLVMHSAATGLMLALCRTMVQPAAMPDAEAKINALVAAAHAAAQQPPAPGRGYEAAGTEPSSGEAAEGETAEEVGGSDAAARPEAAIEETEAARAQEGAAQAMVVEGVAPSQERGQSTSEGTEP